MAGSKRNKVKKLLSPTRAVTPPPPENAADDDALMDDLLAQLDSRDAVAQQESATVLNEMNIKEVADEREAAAPKLDAKARYKARQARKAAALAEKYAPVDADADAKLEKEAREEEKIINATCEELGVKMFEINPDGHCLFSAIADQLVILGIVPDATFVSTRAVAANYMETHPDAFLPFLPSETSDSGVMSPEEFKHYCASIRNTAVWGGEHEILALSRAFNVPIHVIQGAEPHIVPHNPSDKPPPPDSKILRISYHRRMYGLGEHYNSLRPKRSLTDVLKMTFSSSSPP